MSRDEAEITGAMMIPCQWHHTLKYLFKEILQFVFYAFFVFLFARSSGETCKILWMINITHTKHTRLANWICVNAKCSAAAAALKSIWHCAEQSFSSPSQPKNEVKKCSDCEARFFFAGNSVARQLPAIHLVALDKHEPCVEGQRRHHNSLGFLCSSKGAINCKNNFLYDAGFLWYK